MAEERKTTLKSSINDKELLSILLDLSRRMAEIRTLVPLLDFIIHEILVLVNAERGYVVVNRDGKLEFKLSREKSGQKILNEIDQISQSILEYVFDSFEPLLVKNATLDPRFNVASSVVKLRLRSVMCVPLMTNNVLIGAIYVENRTKSGVFTKRALEVLEFFSHHAAISIKNADLNDNLEEIVLKRTEQLKEAKDFAEQTSKAKTDFLAFVSHEVRSPLTAILSYSELLRRSHYGQLTSKQNDAIHYIKNSADHILSLVNDLLDLDKIESGLLDIVLTNVDLNSVIQEIAPIIEGLLHNKRVVLKVQIAESVPWVIADKKRMYQILINILSNAAKFTEEGQILVDVDVTAESFVLLRIEDTGIGIAAKDQELVFQTYRQSKNNPQHISGSGLGLPIAKRLVELQSGRIWLESTLGKGTTFSILLPSSK